MTALLHASGNTMQLVAFVWGFMLLFAVFITSVPGKALAWAIILIAALVIVGSGLAAYTP